MTALEEERAAVLAMLDAPIRYSVPGKSAGLVYDLGEIPASGGGSHIVALALAGMGAGSGGCTKGGGYEE